MITSSKEGLDMSKYVKDIQDCFDFIKDKVQTLEKKVDESWPKIQKLAPMPKSDICVIKPSIAFMFKLYYGDYQLLRTKESVLQKMEKYREQAKLEKELASKTHEENKELIEINKGLHERVSLLMQHIGIPANYSKSYYKTARSRHPTRDTVASGWCTDMNRECSTVDSYESHIKSIDSALNTLESKCKEACLELDKQEREKIKERNNKNKVMALAKLQLKYQLDDDASFEDVRLFLLDKCKYLNLAVAMVDTRGDWSDGFYRVENAIQDFVVETDLDQKIVDDVSSYLDGEHDGRVFRDCEYNYDVLSTLIDEDLKQDYDVVSKYLD